MGLLIFIIWIVRLITSIIAGFISKSEYNNDHPESYYYKGKRPFIYHNKKNFLKWCIPIYGWIWFVFKSVKQINFFNE